jgi:hypothetical protein
MLQRLIVAVGLLVFLTSLSAAQDRKTFKVGTASANRGEKVSGTIEVPFTGRNRDQCWRWWRVHMALNTLPSSRSRN